MTPKEKADKLVHDMYTVRSGSVGMIPLYFAKECALTTVDEIIQEVVESTDNEVKSMRIIYWEKVKQEINNL
jgi:hypothetical protein